MHTAQSQKESSQNIKEKHQTTKEQEKKGTEKNYQTNQKTINKTAVKCIPINDYGKCKWHKCPNQNTLRWLNG